jgi:hypothetical protein
LEEKGCPDGPKYQEYGWIWFWWVIKQTYASWNEELIFAYPYR